MAKKMKIELKKVKVPAKPAPNTKVNFIDKTKFKIYQEKEEQKKEMWDTIKTYLIGMILRWIAKIGGGILLTIGISQNSWEEIITAIISIIAGLVMSIVQHKKALLTDPTEISKLY
ncbi:MAG: hypothetical protein M0P71_15430 [Melioribacteraceae bacterium]|nr:hypothetical protein [Melioribacteraceae bacterium]